jgi:bifunctional DNA-binding transcriptional regulator/antitoxin component of YhaV-PrlF toxin-antitoxin module
MGMYMYESIVGKKYQTVVPIQIRETADIQEGNSLIWEAKKDGSFLVRPQKSKTDYLPFCCKTSSFVPKSDLLRSHHVAARTVI